MRVRSVSKIPVRGRVIPNEAITDHDAYMPKARPEVDAWIARLILAGWKPAAIVAACDEAITVRTVYRWKKALVRLEEVELDGRRAVFAIRRGQPPARISAWVHVADRKAA